MNNGIPLKVSDISFSYQHSSVLSDISFDVPGGTLVGIIGPNGSGKSTLIKVILGFLKPSFGSVEVFGCPVNKAYQRMAYVPQRGEIDWNFPITVRDVVIMGRYGRLRWWEDTSPEDEAIVDEALAAVRMDHFRNRQIGQLSGGQQQRVFLARAIAQKADILLLDEPFTGVDAPTEKIIIELLQSFRNEGRTVMAVHHDLATASVYFDRLLLVKQRLYAYGTPEQVMHDELLSLVYEGSVRKLDQARTVRQ